MGRSIRLAQTDTVISLQWFSAQWYKIITAHKQSFGAIIHNTPDERLRGNLVSILYDEYGFGKPETMHTKLFLRVPSSIGLSEQEIELVKPIAETEKFTTVVDQTWKEQDPAIAYGMLYLFEYVGADFHTKFLQGLEKSGVPQSALEYSKLHAIAEEEHRIIAESGLSIYSDKKSKIQEGIQIGAKLLQSLWDGLERHVYASN